jgi:hypothetical protein
MALEPVTLSGRHVELVPLSQGHRDALAAAVHAAFAQPVAETRQIKIPFRVIILAGRRHRWQLCGAVRRAWPPMRSAETRLRPSLVAAGLIHCRGQRAHGVRCHSPEDLTPRQAGQDGDNDRPSYPLKVADCSDEHSRRRASTKGGGKGPFTCSLDRARVPMKQQG